MASTSNLSIVAGPDGSPAVQIHARGLAVLDDPEVNRGTAFTMAERDHLGLHGLLPVGHGDDRAADRPVLRAVQGQGLRRREVGLPLPAARQQRGALLPAGRGARPRDAADRLHPHRGCGHPGVQPPVPPTTGRLPQRRGRRRHRASPRRDRARTGRHRPGRGLGRRGHPRHRRLGRRRHRHLDRQARRLHGRGRHRPQARPGGRAGRGHQPRVAPQRSRATSACVAPGCAARPTTSSSTPTSPPRPRGSRRRSCTGRTSRVRRRAASWRGTATPSAPSTTTSRARPRWAWPACWPGSGSRAAAWSTSRSWCSAPARPASASPT